MQNSTGVFDAPVLTVENLRTKFDTSIVSNSLVVLIGDFLEARIVQQLHYWAYQDFGVILNERRWIFKPVREWVSEVMIGFSTWQVRKAIASLVQKGLIFKEQLHKEHFGHNYNPKNRTCYYSLNYDRLTELVSEHKSSETIETDRFVSPTHQVCDNQTNGFCGEPQTKTENTISKHKQRTHQPPYRGEQINSSPEPEPQQESPRRPEATSGRAPCDPLGKINLPPPEKPKKLETKAVKPPVKVRSSAELINESTKQKFEELNIPLNRRVRKAISSHHESQVLAVLNRIYMGFESIKNPEDFFCSKISEEKVEYLGARYADEYKRQAEINKQIDAERSTPEAKAKFAELAKRLRAKR